jgi:hypothetical protein
MAGDKFKKKLEEALEILALEDPDGSNQICSNWIIITEWADFKGHKYILSEANEGMTPWLARGMVSEIDYEQFEEFVDEDEEDYEDD